MDSYTGVVIPELLHISDQKKKKSHSDMVVRTSKFLLSFQINCMKQS